MFGDAVDRAGSECATQGSVAGAGKAEEKRTASDARLEEGPNEVPPRLAKVARVSASVRKGAETSAAGAAGPASLPQHETQEFDDSYIPPSGKVVEGAPTPAASKSNGAATPTIAQVVNGIWQEAQEIFARKGPDEGKLTALMAMLESKNNEFVVTTALTRRVTTRSLTRHQRQLTLMGSNHKPANDCKHPSQSSESQEYARWSNKIDWAKVTLDSQPKNSYEVYLIWLNYPEWRRSEVECEEAKGTQPRS